GFTAGTWNFFEASHGKGAPDGVGGALKRRADSQEVVEKKAVFRRCPVNLPPIPFTMRMHQAVTLAHGELTYRDRQLLVHDDAKYELRLGSTDFPGQPGKTSFGYLFEDIVCISFLTPRPVTGRHMEIEKEVWAKLEKAFFRK
ncbi:hypothetical protein NFI96_020780, partial [Prochilodus magdalenae]